MLRGILASREPRAGRGTCSSPSSCIPASWWPPPPRESAWSIFIHCRTQDSPGLGRRFRSTSQNRLKFSLSKNKLVNAGVGCGSSTTAPKRSSRDALINGILTACRPVVRDPGLRGLECHRKRARGRRLKRGKTRHFCLLLLFSERPFQENGFLQGTSGSHAASLSPTLGAGCGQTTS